MTAMTEFQLDAIYDAAYEHHSGCGAHGAGLRAVADAAIAADRAQGAGMDWVSVFKDQDGLHFVIAEEIAAKLTYGQSRFYRRQQPTALPEGYVLEQDAACHATGSIIVRHKQSQCGEYVSIYDNRITYLMLKAMLTAAPKPEQQEAPEVTRDWLVAESELAGKIVVICGVAVSPSLEPGADPLRDRIAAVIAADRAKRGDT